MKMAFDDGDQIGTEIALLKDSRSPVAVGRAVAEFVGLEIAEIDAAKALRFGRAVHKLITVDGRRNVALADVKPQGGQIEVEWSAPIAEALLWIAKTLDERSPVVSGDYQRGHRLFADGVEIDVLGAIPEAREFVFFNSVPYSRKIEIGKTRSGRDFVMQVPPRIYERTAHDAAARFGNIAAISSKFVIPPDGYSLQRNQASRSFARGLRTSRRQRPDRVRGSAVSVPAIIVRGQ